jgi:flagellar basal-body rod protein FlgB
MWEEIDNLTLGATYHLKRTEVIQSNIANADTPGFKPKELVFEKELEKSLALKKTHPKHIDPYEPKGSFKEVDFGKIRGYDDNRVDMQEELAKLAESSIMHKALTENMKKEFNEYKLVIQGR